MFATDDAASDGGVTTMVVCEEMDGVLWAEDPADDPYCCARAAEANAALVRRTCEVCIF